MKDLTLLKVWTKKYLELLKGEFAGLNLTRILEEDEFYHKQILDSLLPIQNSQLFDKLIKKSGIIIDVGFGGGFPLLPLAYNYPEVKVRGVEARNKKVSAVNTIASRLELNNVKAHHIRIETLLMDRPSVVTSKAVGPIGPMLEMINASEEIHVCFYKGPSVEREEKLDHKGWELLEKIEFDLEHHGHRSFLIYKNVPRGTDNFLVKLSDIL